MLKVVTIEHDSDVESPCDWDCSWKVYSFSNRHNNFKHPREFDLSERSNFGLRRKLAVGLAHWLSYYEHGNCLWQLRNGRHVPGSDCPWDSVSTAGIMIWEGKPSDIGSKTRESRTEDARKFLQCYTDWCNGACYWYSISDADDKFLDSCGGFIGSDDIVEAINEHLNDDDEVIVTGDCAEIAEQNNLKCRVLDSDEYHKTTKTTYAKVED